MNIVILNKAKEDLFDGYFFYEEQSDGSGNYFMESLSADIESLANQAGIHPVHFDCHRMLSKKFPYGIFYTVDGDTAYVEAILDLRRETNWIEKRLK